MDRGKQLPILKNFYHMFFFLNLNYFNYSACVARERKVLEKILNVIEIHYVPNILSVNPKQAP